MRIDLKKYAPPGLDLDRELKFFAGGMIGAVLYSTRFLMEYHSAYRKLFTWWVEPPLIQKKAVKDGAVMAPFFELLSDRITGSCFAGYLIVCLCMLAFVAVHYAYFRQGSKSIYLMRRLPDPSLLHRLCWTLPLAGAALCVLCALASLILFFAIYILCTPPECLIPGQW